MAFFTSLTGLNAATSQLGVTSNNIANAGTTGFKRSRAEFGDIFSSSPLQKASSIVGQGTLLKGIQQEFSQGNIEFSQNVFDFAISGEGFFALKPDLSSVQTVFTRNGTFSLNSNRYVVDNAGQFLLGYPVNDDGSVISTTLDSAVELRIPDISGLPKASTEITLGLNLPAAAEVIPERFTALIQTIPTPTTIQRPLPFSTRSAIHPLPPFTMPRRKVRPWQIRVTNGKPISMWVARNCNPP